MGMQQTVRFEGDAIPTWDALKSVCDEKGYPLQMRMINGQLAFPEEAPPDDWNEIRINTPAGMITLRREEQAITFVTWGNAELEMRQAWNALTLVYADLGKGVIQRDDQVWTPDDFRKSAELPEQITN